MTLDELRNQLDSIDLKLMELVAERQKTIRSIADIKRSSSHPLRDFQRERQVFQLGRMNAKRLGVSESVAEDLLRILIRYSLTQQEHATRMGHHLGNGLRALVIGGAGKMGGWFAQFLYSQGFDVDIADPGAAPGEGVFDDWRDCDLNHDYIVVATPLDQTRGILGELAMRKPAGVVFDLASLKSPLAPGLHELRAAGVRVTSIHPMFGPDAELLSGRHVIFVDLHAGDALDKARGLFAPTMANLVVTTLDGHDRLIAYVLGLSHAVNIAFMDALQASEMSVPQLLQMSSTTFDAQFQVARRVALEDPQLYYDIQHLNPYGLESLGALREAIGKIFSAVSQGEAEKFKSIMKAGREYSVNRRRDPEREH